MAQDNQKLSPVDTAAALDDVTALMMQVEPTDSAGLTKLQEALNSVANNEATSETVRELLFEASQRIDEILAEKAIDPNSVFAEVARIVEAAVMSMENPPKDQPPRSPASGPTEQRDPAEAKIQKGETQPAEPASDLWASLLPRDADPDLMNEFITENGELISNAESALLTLEGNPDDMEAVNTVFRAFHTIKGTSGFLGISRMAELAHRAESLLSRMRDQEIRCTGGYADLALRSIDLLKELMQAVQSAARGEAWSKPETYDELMELLGDPEGAGISGETVIAAPRLGDILVAQGKVEREPVERIAATKGDQMMGEALVKSAAASVTDVAKALRMQKRIAGAQPVADTSVRVRTDRLDRLIDMVGELVIAQSMVSQDETVVTGGHLGLQKKVSHSGKIVRDLQDLTLSMRMVPLRATFQKMTRLVRDLAHKSGKSITFVTDGEDTEIDRNMVDVVNDPLVHMVRNAADHGIELPDIRKKIGKPDTGVISLSAYHSGGNVVIEMRDDGKGLDREKIIRKAIDRGLIESGEGLSENEVSNLIFEPGFSTADKITDVSGRGVGLDVVKKAVEALKGRIDLSSEPGKGCTFSMRLPLTLAITDGMLVKVGEERYIIPTASIYKNFRPDRESLYTVAGRGELVVLRGELMPMFRLHRMFRIPGAVEDPANGLLVLVEDGDRHCALLVDELLGQQQVVAKTLGEGVGRVSGVSGGAILGDGRVGLILDPTEIITMARQVAVA